MYKKFMKHAKKVAVDFGGNRPILTGINHFSNGDLAATNSHVLYYAEGLHDKKLDEDTVYSPTGVEIEGQYPNIGRLLPADGDAQFRATLGVAEFTEAMEQVQLPGKIYDDEATVMDFKGNKLTSEVNEISVTYSLQVGIPEEYSFSSNPLNWMFAMKMFKDFGYKEVKFNFYGSMRPFTLVSPDNKIQVLILPVRRY